MRKIIVAVSFILSFTACRDVVGPAEGNTPEGPYAVWFNGLSANASAYYQESDSLMVNGWSTGSAPNQIVRSGDNQFGILSSISADIRFFSGESTGTTIGLITMPDGSNPYSFAISDGVGYAALLLSSSVSVFDTSTYETTGTIPTNLNPSGIACMEKKLFVGHGNYPDPSSPGGVSVIDTDTGELIKWIDTGVNTHWLKLQPSGMLHCYSTTYPDMDGRITIVNPETMSIEAVILCDGAPGEGVSMGDEFLSPDGWGNDGLIKYTEYGTFSRVDLPFAATGLAIHENTLYATSFGANMIYLLDTATFSVFDSLQAGGEGPQGIIAIDPSN
ncbi:MAG: hypothetical protein KAH54_02965 [Candidatus Sabulitectum sp.]|nr:hypothetical protein [Candidatus Sabulitectum sp.]